MDLLCRPWLAPRAVATWLPFLLLPSLTQAAILRVPSEFPTIRGAAAAAVAGDTILVSPGTYYQLGVQFSIRSGVSLVSEQGRDATHLVDFARGGMYFSDDRPAAGVSTLAGFSIYEGAFRFDHPTLVESNFIWAAYPGYSWSWVTSSCEFRGNTFGGAADGYFLMSTLDPEQHATWTFENNLLLTGPGAPFGEIGGWGTQRLVLRNNTGVSFHGIGVMSTPQSTAIEIVNNIFYGTDDNHPANLSCPGHPNVTYDLRYNAYWRALVACPQGQGNLNADPVFCDPEGGDYRLHATSPLIGAGEGGVSIGAFGVGCGVTAAGDAPDPPPVLHLSVLPNPVRHTATFTVQPAQDGWTLDIYDARGRFLDALRPSAPEVLWMLPRNAANGVYFARLRDAGASRVVKFLVLR